AKLSKRLAQIVIRHREKKALTRTGERADIIKAAVPRGARTDGGHPAKRVFQAVRIEVNGELDILRNAMVDFMDVLAPGGVLAVITFHSLEDRIVKQAFREAAEGCTCPKSFPVCVCGKKPKVKVLTKKPVLPSETELAENSRSKSAKLRAVQKL
ncbi:MAG: 16S rRNA (cytosine(1402)-N(4))-methyltransferase RsmH, partial [Clostridia bacterium]|nr:16S rRNA (cytosine(1402)-N(4))-methyltransferase RsmH [Clostridia bacterium]